MQMILNSFLIHNFFHHFFHLLFQVSLDYFLFTQFLHPFFDLLFEFVSLVLPCGLCLLHLKAFLKPFFLNFREIMDSLQEIFVIAIEPVGDLSYEFLAIPEGIFVDLLGILREQELHLLYLFFQIFYCPSQLLANDFQEVIGLGRSFITAGHVLLPANLMDDMLADGEGSVANGLQAVMFIVSWPVSWTIGDVFICCGFPKYIILFIISSCLFYFQISIEVNKIVIAWQMWGTKCSPLEKHSASVSISEIGYNLSGHIFLGIVIWLLSDCIPQKQYCC